MGGGSKMKKYMKYAAIVFLVLYITSSPTSAAGTVNRTMDQFMEKGNNLMSFVSTVAAGI